MKPSGTSNQQGLSSGTSGRPVHGRPALSTSENERQAAEETQRALKPAENLLRQRFETSLAPLFERLTGHRLQMLGHEPAGNASRARVRVLCPSVRSRLLRRGTLPTICNGCALSRSPSDAAPLEPARPLKGRCGALSFAAEVRVGSAVLATLVFQVRPHQTSRLTPEAASSPALAQDLLRLIRHDLQETAWHWRLSHDPVEAAKPLPAPCPPHPPETECDHSDRPQLPRPDLPPTVGRALDFLDQNFSHPITLKALAAELHRNSSYLSDLFSRTIGYSFRQRLKHLRLTKAQELLADGHLSVRDIAQAVGFTEPHEFRWAFRRWTGMSATEWRNQRRLDT